jgi:hypothetical protein
LASLGLEDFGKLLESNGVPAGLINLFLSQSLDGVDESLSNMACFIHGSLKGNLTMLGVKGGLA